ncbi:NAD(P)H-dependent oxidoreductase [Plantactinospora sp. WMMC1484]|uniref:NAD(P)H-dependent oxidoreductase n=1 Tax=Plantactinospora sp. WMMC1484 TaxID=3404122 RepID=UPI003BF5FA06
MSGSLRRESYNSALLTALPALAPEGMEFDHFTGLGEVPPYDQDLEADPPPAVLRWRAAVEAHDGIVLATPEYLRSLPGVMKNAIDWASRPVHTPPLSGKAVLVLVATPGRALGYRSLGDAQSLLTGLRNIVVPAPEVVINSAETALVPDGDAWRLADPLSAAFIRLQLGLLADILESGMARLLEERFRARSAEITAVLAKGAGNGR